MSMFIQHIIYMYVDHNPRIGGGVKRIGAALEMMYRDGSHLAQPSPVSIEPASVFHPRTTQKLLTCKGAGGGGGGDMATGQHHNLTHNTTGQRQNHDKRDTTYNVTAAAPPHRLLMVFIVPYISLFLVNMPSSSSQQPFPCPLSMFSCFVLLL